MTTMLESLHRSRDAITPAMRAAIDRLDATTRFQAAYHFGWIDAEGRPDRGGGKAVRPALALLSARATGGTGEVGLPGAVAVELVHNFSLLHDDLMDHDRERRHRVTVWAQWGSSSAILSGDALLGLAQEVLLDSGLPTAAPAGLLLARATRELIRGQVQDLAFEERESVTVDECLDMAAGKTGSLLAASAAIGAVLAGAPAPTIAALETYGAQLGLAFQLVDDVLGIWGDAAVTGKPVFSDLRAGKKSLPITFALAEDPSIALIDPDDLEKRADAIERAGGRQWALDEAARRMNLGEAALASVELPEQVRTELVALGHFIVDREV
ncbi:polyprenyl synthetase family protein [Actinoplanes solisilvae]|uniref:polyprenyl synthetase family protein n=1 Tax=Actinoplanes solisilvae TaxID=2486853 RepID=UPI000FD9788D|nr:polyprenyl synthetase family protein [Actinoplanes solisilvae]